LACRAQIHREEQEHSFEVLAAQQNATQQAAEDARASLGTCEAHLAEAHRDQRLLAAGLDLPEPSRPEWSRGQAVGLILCIVFLVLFVMNYL
jgi:hypothetical protein